MGSPRSRCAGASTSVAPSASASSGATMGGQRGTHRWQRRSGSMTGIHWKKRWRDSMGSIKVDTSKVGKEVGFSVMAYTTLEYLRTHGSLTREVITDAIAKEYPDLGT